jgi:hypothetical protein
MPARENLVAPVSLWRRALLATPQCLIGILLDTLGVSDVAGLGMVS